ISEVVRSKANIDGGATNRLSNFFHGAFLLLFVSALAPLIQEIPLAALAAMLMVVGFRLASPKQFKHALATGPDQLALFTITLVVTVVQDLLLGILAGCALKLAIHLIRGAKLSNFFRVNVTMQKTDSVASLSVIGPAIFTNFMSLERQVLDASKATSSVVIDFSKATLVDHTTLCCLEGLEADLGNDRLTVTGLASLNRIAAHELSTHRLA
ncbi:MAG TPA: SulP family inorganic anion transporter, partial [Myxococcota bacterium]|nr:SulP family inorganic anion transporter [Myxococcota bacterium]